MGDESPRLDVVVHVGVVVQRRQLIDCIVEMYVALASWLPVGFYNSFLTKIALYVVYVKTFSCFDRGTNYYEKVKRILVGRKVSLVLPARWEGRKGGRGTKVEPQLSLSLSLSFINLLLLPGRNRRLRLRLPSRDEFIEFVAPSQQSRQFLEPGVTVS